MGGLNWTCEGQDWPHREHSHFVTAGSVHWHVQSLGEGPVILLLHGTAASTHSWAGLMPRLARTFRVIAVDLPGHGFSRTSDRHVSSLIGMAEALDSLMEVLGVSPSILIGHSAGAAIALQMALEDRAAPDCIISLNGALMPFPGAASFMFPFLARMIHLNPASAHVLAWAARDRGRVRHLIEQTGSYVPESYIDGYATLLSSPRHVGGTLAMMANWDLQGLAARLSDVTCPVHLFVATRDRAIPASQAQLARQKLGASRVTELVGLGHLAHEEDPDHVAQLVMTHLST